MPQVGSKQQVAISDLPSSSTPSSFTVLLQVLGSFCSSEMEDNHIMRGSGAICWLEEHLVWIEKGQSSF